LEEFLFVVFGVHLLLHDIVNAFDELVDDVQDDLHCVLVAVDARVGGKLHQDGSQFSERKFAGILSDFEKMLTGVRFTESIVVLLDLRKESVLELEVGASFDLPDDALGFL
jgi:hypothetical protein